jgi:RNA polymerase sigma factor (sigma-70 family)
MRPADDEYIKAIQNNDRKGLEQLYQEFLPRISAFLRRNGGSDADAKDVFQDALIVLFKKVQAPEFQLTSGFYTLLYGICRNLWGNRLQKKSGNEVSIPEDYKYTNEPVLTQLIEQQEEEQVFWDAFKQLGQDCQQLLQLFFAKIKMAEIAERMEYSSVGYAKKRKFQCKEQLIKRVKADARYSELLQ